MLIRTMDLSVPTTIGKGPMRMIPPALTPSCSCVGSFRSKDPMIPTVNTMTPATISSTPRAMSLSMPAVEQKHLYTFS